MDPVQNLDLDKIAPPGGLSGSQKEPDHPGATSSGMTLVHMMKDEVDGLIAMNGGKAKKYNKGELKGVYTFPELEPLFNNPKIQRLYAEGYGDESNPELEQYQEFGSQLLPNIHAKDKKDARGVKKIAAKGQDGDNMLVEIPDNLCKLLLQLKMQKTKELPINPETGLLQFGEIISKPLNIVGKVLAAPGNAIGKVFGHPKLGNDMVRGATTVAGAIMGGPWGAGIGHSLGRMATGQEFRKTLLPSAKMGLATWGAQSLLPMIPGAQGAVGAVGNMFGSAAPTVTGGLNSLAGFAAPTGLPGALGTAANSISSGASNFFGGLTGMAGGAAPAAGAGAAATGAGAAAKAAAPGMLGKLGQLAASPLGIVGLTHGLGYMGSRRSEKNEEDARRREKEEYLEERKRSGIDRPFAPAPARRRHLNPDWKGDTTKPAYLYEPDPQGLAKGGSVRKKNVGFQIKGPGKGQDDLIHTKGKVGDWIIDASTVGMLGDGDTGAGAQVFKKFLDQHAKGGKPSKKGEWVDVAYSNGEVQVPAHKITQLGGGSNDHGAHLMRAFTERVRKHKISNGVGLPPKAHDPALYFFQ